MPVLLMLKFLMLDREFGKIQLPFSRRNIQNCKSKKKNKMSNFRGNKHSFIKFATKHDFTHFPFKITPYHVFPLKPGNFAFCITSPCRSSTSTCA